MSFREVLRAVLSRWWLLVLAVLAAGSVGWLSAPDAPPPVPKYYKATQTLIVKPDPAMFTPSNPATIALLASQSEVSSRVAARLVDDPTALNGILEITGDPVLAVVLITARADTAELASAVADTYADELETYLGDREAAERTTAIADLRSQSDDALRQIAAIDLQLAGEPADAEVLEEQRDVLWRQQNDAAEELVELETTPPVLAPVESVGPSVARPIYPSQPRSAAERAAILSVLGVLAGGALVLALHRLDVRISTAEQATAAFGLPVLAEIPAVPRRARRRRSIASVDDPASPIAEAYRILRTTLLITRPTRSERGGHVVLVTSTAPSEGKSTTVANLAAVFADTNRSVLVLGADLRRPTVHEHFGAPREPGLTDVLAGGASLRDVVHLTNVRGVVVVPAGRHHRNPGELILGLPAVVDEARTLADIVIVDGTPLLTLNDAALVVPTADTVLVVVRARHATTTAASRAKELLRRLGDAGAGIVLVAARDPRTYTVDSPAPPPPPDRRELVG